MKCGLIRDLLPSFIDGLTCEDSNSVIEEHLKSCDACREYYTQMSRYEFEPAFLTDTEQEGKAFSKALRRFRVRMIGIACTVFIALLISVYVVGYLEIPLPYSDVRLDVWVSGNLQKEQILTEDGTVTEWFRGLQSAIPAGAVSSNGAPNAIVKKITIDGQEQYVVLVSAYHTLNWKRKLGHIVERGNEERYIWNVEKDTSGTFTLGGHDISDITAVYYLDNGIKRIENRSAGQAGQMVEKNGHLIWTKEIGNQPTYYCHMMDSVYHDQIDDKKVDGNENNEINIWEGGIEIDTFFEGDHLTEDDYCSMLGVMPWEEDATVLLKDGTELTGWCAYGYLSDKSQHFSYDFTEMITPTEVVSVQIGEKVYIDNLGISVSNEQR